MHLLATPRLPTLALAAQVPGAQPEDALYLAGALAVAAFGLRSVFDSLFPENAEYKPPLPGKLPRVPSLFGAAPQADPLAKAERLRAELTDAVAAQDMAAAMAAEKVLRQHLGENGLVFEPDESAAIAAREREAALLQEPDPQGSIVDERGL